jgi:hypothetical protein
MLLTNVLIIVPSVLFLAKVAISLSLAVVVLAVISLIALLAVFLVTACSDPGIVYSSRPEDVRGADEEKAEPAISSPLLTCSQCKVIRPITASRHSDMHCSCLKLRVNTHG